MPRLQRQSRFGPSKGDWIPPALTAAVSAALMVAVFVAWRRFIPVSQQIGMGDQGRTMLLAFLVIVEVLLGWRVWSLARKARELWTESRGGSQ